MNKPIKTLCIFIILAFISASLPAQTAKTVTVYDTPDHSEWHTEEVREPGYTGNEYSFDLKLLDTVRYVTPDTCSIEYYKEMLETILERQKQQPAKD